MDSERAVVQHCGSSQCTTLYRIAWLSRLHCPADCSADSFPQVLIADFFFVCLALAWLAAGVGEKGALHSSVSANPFCHSGAATSPASVDSPAWRLAHVT